MAGCSVVGAGCQSGDEFVGRGEAFCQVEPGWVLAGLPNSQVGAGIESWLVRLDEMSRLKGFACRFGLSGKLAAGLRVWAARGEWKAAVQMIEIDTEAEIDTGPDMEIDGIFTTAICCKYLLI
ncbi:MAG: hypothetical protein O2977_07340 [Cyanobacteria bacterium]|nr:hypothetical protein [Cyanobacteriota bacterium]